MRIFKEKIKQKLLSTYFICIALFWFGFFIYIRFFKKKTSYTLTALKNAVTLKLLFLQIIFILFHIINIIYAIYIIYRSSNIAYEPRGIITYIKKLLDITFTQPLTYVRDILAPIIPYSGIIFCHFGTFLGKSNPNIAKFFVILFSLIPRIIVAMIFFIEIIFFEEIYYFLISLVLLFIPILWSIFVNLFINFGERALKDIQIYINVSPVGDMLPNGWYKEYFFEPNTKYECSANDLKEYEHLWHTAMIIYAFGYTHFKYYKDITMPYVTIFCSSLYLSAGLYKFLFILIIF